MDPRLAWPVGIALGAFVLLWATNQKGQVNDVRIDPDLGKHRGLAPTYGVDNTPTRMPSNQDVRGGPADYLGYTYARTLPSVYANDQWNKDKLNEEPVDQWAPVDRGDIDYHKPPERIPALFKDDIRYWDAQDMQGGVRLQQQSIHLFHLRPSVPTRGYRSISGSLNPIGGGQSTASNARIPAVFVPSQVS